MNNRTLLFPLHGFINWNGGVDLARVFASALLHPSVTPRFDVKFAYPSRGRLQRAALSAIRQLRRARAGGSTGGNDSGSPAALLKAAEHIASSHELISCSPDGKGIVRATSAAAANIVFPTMLPLGKAALPRVAYLFDFQHLHLPQLFSPRVRRNRTEAFARLAEDASGVVVNSRSVAADAHRFLGLSSDRILVIPYTPHALPWWFEFSPEQAMALYGISAPYLLVCNHFWTHKDHETALRAFAQICKSSDVRNLQMVFTGDPIDHRDPKHYGRLQALTRKLGLEDKTHFLGLVPKKHQLALLRGCSALVQPTLFEGGPGGGSVYEAIGLGTRCIVSDIPVNREIDQGDITYFRAGDSIDLAEQIARLAAEPAPPPPSEALLLAIGDRNLQRLGEAICSYLAQLLV